MKSFLANNSATLSVDFIVGGNYVQPDEGSSASWTLLGNDFSPIDGYSNVEIPAPSGTYVSVTVPAEANGIADGNVFEIRTIVVSAVFNGNPSTFRAQYRVAAYAAYTATKDSVRLVFGLNDSDVADDQIDLDSAYYELLTTYPTIETWFKSGGANSIKANRILVLTCALSFSNGLRLLAAASESDGESKMTRFNGIDFDKMIDDAKSELERLVDELTDEDSSAGAISYFNVVTTEDIFTGE